MSTKPLTEYQELKLLAQQLGLKQTGRMGQLKSRINRYRRMQEFKGKYPECRKYNIGKQCAMPYGKGSNYTIQELRYLANKCNLPLSNRDTKKTLCRKLGELESVDYSKDGLQAKKNRLKMEKEEAKTYEKELSALGVSLGMRKKLLSMKNMETWLGKLVELQKKYEGLLKRVDEQKTEVKQEVQSWRDLAKGWAKAAAPAIFE